MTLEVLVSKAANLPNIERFGKIDPYVVVVFKDITKRTQHKESELNPEWNEKLTFDLKDKAVSERDEIKISVKDHEMIGPDRLVGMKIVMMYEVMRSGKQQQKAVPMALRLTDSDDRPSQGILSVTMSYYPPADSIAAPSEEIGAKLSDEAEPAAATGAGDSRKAGPQVSRWTSVAGAVGVQAASSSRLAAASTKPQDFQVRVKIVEARQLAGANINPVCRLTCHKQAVQTRIKQATNAPFWNQAYVFSFHVAPGELFDRFLHFTVLNSRKFRSDAMIGSFKCDIGLIYDEPQHALINKWLLLSNPAEESEGAKGFLKICAAVLGPNDDAPTFLTTKSPADEDIEANLLRPAGIPLRPATFKLRVYCAEDLPRMDPNFLEGVKKVFTSGETRDLIDPYLTFTFAGVNAKTKIVYNNAQPNWNQELRVGFHFPSICEKLKLQLMDWDFIDTVDPISTSLLDLQDVSHPSAHGRRDEGFLPTFGPCFVNFYGAPREFSELPTDCDVLNEGVGEGVAYRGRVLVELQTVLGDMPNTPVEDISADSVIRVQKFLRRRKFRLNAAILDATLISTVDAPVEFEVSIGNYGNKHEEHLIPGVSTTQPTNSVFDGCYYYYLPWSDNKPCLSIDCHWEDVIFRLESMNLLQSIADRLEDSIQKLRVAVRANMPDVAALFVKFADQLITDCGKKFPEADPSIQIETHLDVSLRNWRLAELSCIADDVRNLRDDVTDMNEAIEELEMKLCTLKKLAVDPQSSIPDVIIWMLSGDKRIAYYRCPAHLLLYSPNPEYRGKYCGMLDAYQLEYPANLAERQNRWEIPALISARIWLGLEKYEHEWRRVQKEGEIAVFAETYENQVSILGNWTNKGPMMTRPKWSDEAGQIELNKDDFVPPTGWKWDSDWYISLDFSVTFDKDSGHKVFMDDTYENESRLPGGVWSPAGIPWTDVKGDKSPAKLDIEAPDGWEWTDEWQVDLNRAVDEYGWEYAVEASHGGFGPVERRYHMSRRRRWVRTRHLAKSPDKTAVKQKQLAMAKEGWEYAAPFSSIFHATERTVDIVRRRRWHRRMVVSDDQSGVVLPTASCAFRIASKKKDDQELSIAAPRIFLTCPTPHHYQLRVYIYQARNLLAGDASGLSDPFARVAFLNYSQATEKVEKTLCPTWDQTLLFDDLEICGEPPDLITDVPWCIIEIFDHDPFGTPDFLGRARAIPQVNLDASNAAPLILQWYDIKKGQLDGGEILFAAELFLIEEDTDLPFHPPKRGQLYMVPTGIRPQFVRTGVEIMCWGVRNMKNFDLLSVKSPSVEITVGDATVQSNVIADTDRNPNFDEPLIFRDILLPKEELYTPPIIIQVRDNRMFGRKPLVGVHTVKSVATFRLQAARTPRTGARSDQTVIDIMPDVAEAVKVKKESACTVSAKRKKKPKKVVQEAEVDWWSKYYASKGETDKCIHYLEQGYDKIEMFRTPLERVEPFNDFVDFCTTFYLTRGKNIEDESDIIGEFKGTFRLYPLPDDPAVPLPPRVLSHLPPSSPVDCIVRVYVIRAFDLVPSDENGLADPYVKIKIGKVEMDSSEEYIPNSIEPFFGRMFELQTSIPVAKDLHVSVMDFDMISADDLIGETVVDLENRYLSKHRATVGLPRSYCTTGVCRWRDSKLPTQILAEFCEKHFELQPVYRDDETVEIDNVTYTLEHFEKTKPSHEHLGEAKERLALHVLNYLPGNKHIPLVPEHIESRPIYSPLQPGIEQGRLEMWVDLYPLGPDSPPPPAPIDIQPRTPKKYELRAIIWNTTDVIMEETSITGEQMSDIYVKGWIAAIDMPQSTDVHYRSMDGDGNFNWRFVFPFEYIVAEQCVVIKRKEHFWSLDETEIREPPVFVVQIWDNDKFSADDFLGTLELNLQSMPPAAKKAKECNLDMLPDVGAVEKKRRRRREPPKLVSLFDQKRVRGFWPCYRRDESGQRELTGKVEMELEILTEAEAAAKPAGVARDEPNQHPKLDSPVRPETSFLWFTSPLKTCKLIVWDNYKWKCLLLFIIILIILFVALFIYAVPNAVVWSVFGL